MYEPFAGHAWTRKRRTRIFVIAHTVKQLAEEAVAICDEHGFPVWMGLALLFRGWSFAGCGQREEGLAILTKALSMYRATGAVIMTPLALILLAEAHAQLGQPVEGLNCLAEATQIIEATEERCNESELHGLRGDLLDATGHPFRGAELSSGARRSAPAKREIPGAARWGESRPSLARPRQTHRGTRPPRADLRLVHRRLGHAGPARRQNAARRAGVTRFRRYRAQLVGQYATMLLRGARSVDGVWRRRSFGLLQPIDGEPVHDQDRLRASRVAGSCPGRVKLR